LRSLPEDLFCKDKKYFGDIKKIQVILLRFTKFVSIFASKLSGKDGKQLQSFNKTKKCEGVFYHDVFLEAINRNYGGCIGRVSLFSFCGEQYTDMENNG
jgi:hypothetical protein